jgi:hypothetical protein
MNLCLYVPLLVIAFCILSKSDVNFVSSAVEGI